MPNENMQSSRRRRSIRAFISYAREDVRIALRLNQDLRMHGIATWIDHENLLPGDDWESQIKRALWESSHVIVLLSEFSVNKRGFFQQEIRIALEVLGQMPPGLIYILPVRLDSSEPAHDQLARLQWVNLYDSYEEGLAKIARRIKPRRVEKRERRPPFERSTAILTPNDIILSSSTLEQATAWGYEPDNIIDFLITEHSRHALAYASPFNSVPLIYRRHMLLISWNGFKINVEAIAQRELVFPKLGHWLALLRAYREGLALPHRKRGPGTVLFRSEIQHCLKVSGKIVEAAATLSGREHAEQSTAPLDMLLHEAQVSFDDDPSRAIARVEMIISSAHKLMLMNVPGQFMTPSTSASPDPTPFPDSTNHKIATAFVVDDEIALAELMRKILEKSGLSVLTFYNASDALRAVIQQSPDVVVTDLTMPGLSGLDLAQAMSQVPAHPAVVLVSGYPDYGEMAATFGFDKFIQKPFSPQALLDAVEHLLEDRKAVEGR